MTLPARRPWWKKKRWAAALALWLLSPALYGLSIGPMTYCWLRGWISEPTLHGAYWPIDRVWPYLPKPVKDAHVAYVHLWHDLAERTDSL